MSITDLTAVLADAGNNGAYFVDVRDREAVCEAARTLQFAVVTIDCAHCADRDAILDRFAQALAFPDWFGRNWDALADCLDDLSWLPATAHVLLIEHIAAWREDAPDEFAVLIEVLDDVAARRGARSEVFQALITLSAEQFAAAD